MLKATHIVALASSIAIAGCATQDAGYEVVQTGRDVPEQVLVAPPTELAGTVIRAETVDGTVANRVHFYPNNVIHIVPEDGAAAIQGTYAVRGNMLCLDWAPRGTECWPYQRAFAPGETVVLTSDRGQMAEITMLNETAVAVAPVVTEPAPVPRATQTPPPAQTYVPPAESYRAGERG